MIEVREIVRRSRLGETSRAIAGALGTSRNTVSKYLEIARSAGWLEAPTLPDPATMGELLQRECQPTDVPGPSSEVEPYREFVLERRKDGVPIKALHQLLVERGFTGSYSAVRRFVRRHDPTEPEGFLRIETLPGEEAQVDFGYVGKRLDPRTGRRRKAWVFVMTLSFSRHIYVEMVFDQSVETWIRLHVRAFEWFGGVPRRIVLDNLKAGITRAAFHDPVVNRSYTELAEVYGFLISPCRIKRPRDKGKVESGVRYVKCNALPGRDDLDIVQANQHLRTWATEIAGLRIHGTTHEKPLDRFAREKDELLPLPRTRYDIVLWHEAKLHSDYHVICRSAFYSAPHRLVGKKLWIRATSTTIEIYHDHERVATHERATRKGERKTHPDHLPPEKVHGLRPHPEILRDGARKVGPFTTEVIETCLGDRPLDRLRTAKAILDLGRRHGPARLEAACQRAHLFDEVKYIAIKRILDKGLDTEPLGEALVDSGPLPRTSIFARTTAELVPTGAR